MLYATALLSAVAVSGCAQATNSDSSDEPVAEDVSSVEVDDVTGQDGADAVAQLEGDELTVVLDPDADREPNGCEVTDQNPAGGDTVDDPETEPVTLTLDCRQVDWEAQEGEDWDSYTSAYSEGFTSGCQQLFAQTDSEMLFEGGVPRELGSHDEADCEALASDPEDPPADVPDDPSATGTEEGELAGCEAIFEDSSNDTLYESSKPYYESDCPQGPAPAQPAPKASKKATQAPLRSNGPLTIRNGRVIVPTTGPLPEYLRKPNLKASDLYRVDRVQWNSYSAEVKLQVAQAFIDNNPTDCVGVDAEALLKDADEVLNGPGNGNFRANDILLDSCKTL